MITKMTWKLLHEFINLIQRFYFTINFILFFISILEFRLELSTIASGEMYPESIDRIVTCLVVDHQDDEKNRCSLVSTASACLGEFSVCIKAHASE